MTTVALLSHTGLVGRGLLKPFLAAHVTKQINLVILHRPDSDISSIPNDIEKRVLDLVSNDRDEITAAVEGIEILISALGSAGLPLQTNLFPALAASKSLRAFVPSDFGTDWSEDDLAGTELDFVKIKYDVVKKARALNIPTTEVKTGIFAEIFFAYKVLGVDVNANAVKQYGKNLTSPFPITGIADIGRTLLQRIPALPPKLFIYTVVPTGQDIINTLTSVHAHQTEITEYTDAENESGLRGAHNSVIVASLWRKWARDDWAGEEKKEGLETIIRQYM